MKQNYKQYPSSADMLQNSTWKLEVIRSCKIYCICSVIIPPQLQLEVCCCTALRLLKVKEIDFYAVEEMTAGTPRSSSNLLAWPVNGLNFGISFAVASLFWFFDFLFWWSLFYYWLFWFFVVQRWWKINFTICINKWDGVGWLCFENINIILTFFMVDQNNISCSNTSKALQDLFWVSGQVYKFSGVRLYLHVGDFGVVLLSPKPQVGLVLVSNSLPSTLSYERNPLLLWIPEPHSVKFNVGLCNSWSEKTGEVHHNPSSCLLSDQKLIEAIIPYFPQPSILHQQGKLVQTSSLFFFFFSILQEMDA